MTTKIRKPAIKIVQGKHTLYATTFTIADFLRGDEFYRVDQLDVADATVGGYQRLLDERRAKALAKDLVNAAVNDEMVLPTSILLATAGEVAYNGTTKEISFSTDPKEGTCPFNVVDGQHRIEGLRQFATEVPDMAGFPVAVNIATGLNTPQQMLQFVTVNTKQRTVDKGLVKHITARFTGMEGFETLPYLPSWLEREVEKGADKLATDIVAYLSDEADSPWCGKITRVNASRERGHTVKEYAFANSVISHILSANNPLSRKEPDMRNKILKNYWRAVDSLFVAGGNTVVYKTTGINFFHLVSAVVIGRCDDLKDYRVETIKSIFQKAHEELGAAGYMYPEWWESGNEASGMNRGGIAQCASELSKAVEASSVVSGKGIQI